MGKQEKQITCQSNFGLHMPNVSSTASIKHFKMLSKQCDKEHHTFHNRSKTVRDITHGKVENFTLKLASLKRQKEFHSLTEFKLFLTNH